MLGQGASASAQMVSSLPLIDRLKADAESLEKAGQWERAWLLYSQALAIDRSRQDCRNRLQWCLRHILLMRRHQDPLYRQYTDALSFHESLNLFVEVLGKLQTYYVDREKCPPDRLVQQGIDELEQAFADPTFRQTHLASATDAESKDFLAWLRQFAQQKTIRDSRDARQFVRDTALAAQRSVHISNPVVVVLEFVCGACNSLDEWTHYQTPSALGTETHAVPDLSAFGLRLVVRNNRLEIEEVLPESLAASQYLFHKGDFVHRVNRRKLSAPTAAALTEALRQPLMDGIEIEISSADGANLTVLRFPSRLPTVLYADTLFKDEVGYVRILAFRDSTLQELDDALLSLRARGMKVLLLDLRGNPGGLFPVGIQVAARFLASGVIVSTQGQLVEFNHKTHSATAGMSAFELPMVVLIDGDTASSAEVVAGALKENERARLVGTATFGKGTIQGVLRLQHGEKNDGSDKRRWGPAAIRLTLARFLSPSGQPYSGVGVTPHVFEPNRERQLDTAIDEAIRLIVLRAS